MLSHEGGWPMAIRAVSNWPGTGLRRFAQGRSMMGLPFMALGQTLRNGHGQFHGHASSTARSKNGIAALTRPAVTAPVPPFRWAVIAAPRLSAGPP